MKTLCIAAIVILAGCGSQVAPTGGAISAGGASASHGKSWMKPGSSSGDLLYVGSFVNGVYVLTYPKGQLVTSFQLPSGDKVTGLCSDGQGDVFATVANDGAGFISEYAHGGTTAIATVQDRYEPVNCAVDPLTGNLAATDLGHVAIYQGARGEPTYYSGPTRLFFCTYDDSGNLFVDALNFQHSEFHTILAELPYGGNSFTDIALNKYFRQPGSLQWLGSYLAMSAKSAIYHISVSGSEGTISGKTAVNEMVGPWEIDGDILVGLRSLGHVSHEVAYWQYPKGGNATKLFNMFGRHSELVGVTISVAP